MILLRNKMYSSKKKTDKETERQKKDRKKSAITTGLLASGASGLVAGNAIMDKFNRDQAKVYQQSGKHLDKINEKEKLVDRNIDLKAKELLNDSRIKKEGKLGERKVILAAKKLKLNNALLNIEKIKNLDAATNRLLKRLERKRAKAGIIAGLGSTAIGIGTGLVANNAIKKRNKKINRIRRHIED